MKHTTKRIIALAAIAVLAISTLVGCGNKADSDSGNVTIKVGASITPHSEILEQAKPILPSKA